MRLGLGHGLRRSRYVGGKAVSFETEYQAVLDEGTTQGYTLPSSTQQEFQNTLVKSLKEEGIWDSLDVFYVFATDGDSDFATLNWKDPSQFQATKVNAPTFTTNEGFTGDGSSAYLNTNWNPVVNAINYTAESASFGGYYRSLGGSGDAFIGNSGANHIERFTTTYRYEINGPDASTYPIFDAGFIHANRSSSISTQFYSNGVLDQTDNHSSGATINANMRVLDDDGSNFSTAQVSVSFVANDLSTEANELFNNVETYMSNIGTSVVP